MFRVIYITILSTLTILLATIEANSQKNNLLGSWRGKLIDSLGEFDYQLNLNEEKNGQYIGISVSNSSGFYCETNIIGIKSGNKLIIIESGIKKTNYEKKDLICLLKFEFDITKNSLKGIYTPINNKSNCLNGKALLYKDEIKSITKLKQNKIILESNDIKQTIVPTVNKPNEISLNSVEIKDEKYTVVPEVIKTEKKDEIIEKRDSRLIKTIVLDEDEAELFIYDNGVIDGDIITLIDNNKVLFKKVLLSQKPIILKINNLEEKTHEIQFFAENLGEIAPNTGLLVVKTKTRKIDLFFSSDLVQSSLIKIVLK